MSPASHFLHPFLPIILNADILSDYWFLLKPVKGFAASLILLSFLKNWQFTHPGIHLSGTLLVIFLVKLH